MGLERAEDTCNEKHDQAQSSGAWSLLDLLIPSAQAKISEKDKAACTPDVFRLCGEYILAISERDKKITECLKANKSSLSKDCFEIINPLK